MNKSTFIEKKILVSFSDNDNNKCNFNKFKWYIIAWTEKSKQRRETRKWK